MDSELSDKYYDQISKDIQSVEDYRQLNDAGPIDRRIRRLNDANLSNGRKTEILQQERRGHLDLFLKEKALSDYDTYNKQIDNYYSWQWVHLLTNDSPLTNNIMNLNQTLLSPEKDKNVLIELRKFKYYNLLYDLIKKNMEEDTDKNQFADNGTYDILIQGLDQNYLKPPKSVDELQKLRKELGSKLQPSTNRNKNNPKNFYEALDSLVGTFQAKRMIKDYILDENDISILKNDEYFDHRIELLDDKNKKILLNLRNKIVEVYEKKIC
ncbi:13750_t:CDS:2 [Ambispora leptoticha]|uniref:13750_t:CDS:1 n=1 Tax=Ambispora leptoticha TaxID=144679 RepID=A0A9N9AER4_9GLOM|nr:13750_t:CDS:2 [Ambispora leptoticha]